MVSEYSSWRPRSLWLSMSLHELRSSVVRGATRGAHNYTHNYCVRAVGERPSSLVSLACRGPARGVSTVALALGTRIELEGDNRH